jgi:hypothetical protein
VFAENGNSPTSADNRRSVFANVTKEQRSHSKRTRDENFARHCLGVRHAFHIQNAERSTGNDFKGSPYGVIEVVPWEFAWREWGEKTQVKMAAIPVGIGRRYIPNASPECYCCRALASSMAQLSQ